MSPPERPPNPAIVSSRGVRHGTSADPDPSCNDLPVVFFLAKSSADAELGEASTGEPRDTTDPDPVSL